jgi:hypothetical protein
MAYIVVKKLGSLTGGRMFEFTKHANELGLIAGKTDHPWEVWVQGPEKTIDTKYEVVFAATNNNQHDRLNFRENLHLSKNQKTQHRWDKTLRGLFGIPESLDFIRAQVLISLVPQYRRVILTIRSMQWS